MTIGTSRIFRSTDEGAPQFSEVIGSMIPVLQAVLVDGYGDKESLNWELVYSDTNKIVVRPRFGTRQYIRFYDYSTTYVHVSSFSTMSNLDYGVDRMPDYGTESYFVKRYSSGTANVPWMIIGDELGFYLVHQAFYPYYPGNNGLGALWICYYVGDYVAWDINNRWNFCLLIQSGTTNYCGGLHPLTHGGSYIIRKVKRGSSFKRGVVDIRLLPFNNNTFFGHNNYIRPITGVQAINGMYYHCPVHIIEGSNELILGTMPGLYEPISKSSSTKFTYSTVPYIEYNDGNGLLNILLCANAQENPQENVLHKLIFKVGPGFRNVQ